jgi:5-methylcytosine-specific restriction endonuclease McrA
MPTIKLLQVKQKPVKTTRKGEFQDIYQDKRWRKLRGIKLRNNPLCERCEENNRTTAAIEVHHIIPFDWGISKQDKEDLAFDYDNLKSVCDPCHDLEHDDLKKQASVLKPSDTLN